MKLFGVLWYLSLLFLSASDEFDFTILERKPEIIAAIYEKGIGAHASWGYNSNPNVQYEVIVEGFEPEAGGLRVKLKFADRSYEVSGDTVKIKVNSGADVKGLANVSDNNNNYGEDDSAGGEDALQVGYAIGAGLQVGFLASIDLQSKIDQANEIVSNSNVQLKQQQSEYKFLIVHLVSKSVEVRTELDNINTLLQSSGIAASAEKFDDHKFNYALSKKLNDINAFKFKSTKSEFLVKAEPVYNILKSGVAKSADKESFRLIGAAALMESDKSSLYGEPESSELMLSIAKVSADILVGIDPITGFARSLYEFSFGYNMITGEALSPIERALAGLGVISGGGSSAAGRGILMLAPLAKRLGPVFIQSLSSVNKIFEKLSAIGYQKVSDCMNLLRGQKGKLISDIVTTGKIKTGLGVQVFDTTKSLSNAFPENGVFARVMSKAELEQWLNGNLLNSLKDLDKKEIFISAAEDIATTNRFELVKKLSLFEDNAATMWRNLDDHVKIEFKFKKDIDFLTIPKNKINESEYRGFGHIDGGKTQGGAREWIVDFPNFNDFIDSIDKQSIKVYELVN